MNWQHNLQHSSEVNTRIATYNIQAGSGMDGKYDLDRIATTIRESGADIIGLQEVDVHWGSRSQYEDTLAILAEKLDMYYFFAPIYDLEPVENGDPRRQYGVGILSKYPIVEANNHEITRLSSQEPNPTPKPAPGFLEAQIRVDGVNVWFYVTHLDSQSDPTVRQMQINDMHEIMAEHQYNILVGDMNARPDADELNPLFHWFDDAWDVTKGTSGYTFPTDAPDRRIDYILSSPRMHVNNAQLHHSQASDHLPVTADVTVVRGNHSLLAEGMRMLVELFDEKGEFAGEHTVRALEINITTVSYYEREHNAAKVLKHLDKLSVLLDALKKNEMISEDAYSLLQSDTEYLIDRWREKEQYENE
ncbi:endonuclease/exonuclease/phosphatase family protein [Virgibacillus sp. NKC19-3]|nr:endonuclease/exonuclease/phosphatase family protein [Virgibacillus sp. NKC19-3]